MPSAGNADFGGWSNPDPRAIVLNKILSLLMHFGRHTRCKTTFRYFTWTTVSTMINTPNLGPQDRWWGADSKVQDLTGYAHSYRSKRRQTTHRFHVNKAQGLWQGYRMPPYVEKWTTECHGQAHTAPPTLSKPFRVQSQKDE